MKRVLAIALITMLMLPTIAWAGSASDAALGLGAFAALGTILLGAAVFGNPAIAAPPVVYAPPPPVYAPPPVVYAPPPPVVYAPPPPVYAPPPVVYAPPPPVYGPPPVVYAPRPAYGHRPHWRYGYGDRHERYQRHQGHRY